MWTGTCLRMDAATCACARSKAGSNGDRPRTAPCYSFESFLSLPPPFNPTPRILLTSRGMIMGLPVKGHSLRRVHQLPVAKGTGATVAAQHAPTWKITLAASSGIAAAIASPLETPRRTVTRRERVHLFIGETRMWPGHRC